MSSPVVEVTTEAPKPSRARGNGDKMKYVRTLECNWENEDIARIQFNANAIAGCDESGAGPLMGPVCASAVILDRGVCIDGLRDSKLLTAKQRERLDKQIREDAIAVSVAEVSASWIDRINIYQARKRAMLLAIRGLDPQPDFLLIDALTLDTKIPQVALIHGDAKSVSIAASSIVAKVYRDSKMEEYDRLYPGYGFLDHKGYGTPAHLEALRRLGPTPLHRKSFRPVRELETLTSLF
jgi:ribonuclease HII